tara:strand:- start:413 stop:820 length:408 start_codon:yes stop_codon:yes gene_type:complete
MKIKFLNILKEGVIDYPFKNTRKLTIINDEGKKVDVQCELAQKPEEKQQGLLHRYSLCDNCGVLFDSDRNSGYHMVDMKFPIEMIFINGGQVVEIISAGIDEENISPTDSFSMNLEVNDGFSKKNNISVGNNIIY